jgi:hypothetical protein
MPTSDEILAGLTAISRQGFAVAIIWHVLIAFALVALASGSRPSQRVARVLITMPLVSVAAFAFVFGNPFNGWLFAGSAVALTALALRADRSAVGVQASWITGAGIAAILFGWLYPHFLDGNPTVYLYASPVGLVPCPTLSIAIGFALLGARHGARSWCLLLSALGLFYGLFGFLRLGVVLDLGLVAGAVVLLGTTVSRPHLATRVIDAR